MNKIPALPDDIIKVPYCCQGSRGTVLDRDGVSLANSVPSSIEISIFRQSAPKYASYLAIYTQPECHIEYIEYYYPPTRPSYQLLPSRPHVDAVALCGLFTAYRDLSARP